MRQLDASRSSSFSTDFPFNFAPFDSQTGLRGDDDDDKIDGTALEGAIACRAKPVHLGRTTQVWDAEVTVEGTEKRIALFRCTQMVLWPKAPPPTSSP